MRPVLPLFALCLLIGSAIAQTTPKGTTPPPPAPPPLLTSKDSLFLEVTNGKKFVQHPVKAKQTLYSIAKYYSLSFEELYDHNPSLRTDPSLRAGMRLKIPLPNLAIKRYKTKKFVASRNTPIYYRVQEGDNLYQICKRNFDMPVDSIAKRNSLKNSNIRPGQLLLVAWMGTEGVLPEWRPVRQYTASDALKAKYEEAKMKRREVDSQGVCFWQKDSKEKGELYALHREAAVGTPICVINPMGGRSVYAKVIGRIPEGYERNIEVVLSPEAARNIGARDPKFFVKVKFLK